jgi:hypothetical protein
LRVRRPKPYVCVDCDFAEHFRFQDTKDLEAAAGTWLRCLAYSRAQEQDGVVKASWLKRTFARTYERIDELVAVGLLRVREDGDYELHAYAPRNQTRAMLADSRETTRLRVATWRERLASEGNGEPEHASGDDVTRYNGVTRGEKEADKTPCNAFVPTSTSINTSSSDLLRDLHNVTEIQSSQEGGVQRGAASGAASFDVTGARRPLPRSERGLSGPAWLAAFTEGIASVTGRPCTAGRVYLGTLERIVTHHAPARDATTACSWLRDEAKAFAKKWDGKHPAKGLTPDGLERWLNEGRQGPPQFGRERVVQLPADEWHEDDFSDLGAEVLK